MARKSEGKSGRPRKSSRRGRDERAALRNPKRLDADLRDLSGDLERASKGKPHPAKLKSTEKKERPRRRPRLMWRVTGWLVALCILAMLFPLTLGLFYTPNFIKPISSLMVRDMVNGKNPERSWVALENIAPSMSQSVVSSEDGQFCRHGGVDWAAVNLVVDDLMEGESPRGASTITMQVAKNLFLWPQRSYLRKFLEVPLALYIDALWGKKRVMEVYLNIAEWGPNIYGVEAAARHYFKRSARRLSRRQAALLTVALPNPKLRNPAKPGSGLNRLARLIERRARASGAYVKCLR